MPITLREIVGRRGDATFEYAGQSVHIEYHTEKITKEFREASLRLMRDGARIAKRAQEFTQRIQTVDATEGSDEAAAEDKAAEEAIAQIKADDDILKRKIDKVLCDVLAVWDVMDAEGKMYPITEKSLFPIPADFERAILEAIIAAATQGEANGRPSTKP